MRENYIEGDYLNSRPEEGVRLKLNEYPQAFIRGPRDAEFSALLRINAPAKARRSAIDTRFLSLLDEIGAQDLRAIEPYD